MLKNKRIVIIESLNVFTLLYLIVINIFKKTKIFCLSYQPFKNKIYEYFKIKVVDINFFDLSGFNIPSYFLNDFPDLKIKINENSFILTEKYSRIFFEEDWKLFSRIIRFSKNCDIFPALKRYIILDFKNKVKCIEFASTILKYEKVSPAIYLPNNNQWDFLLKDELYKAVAIKTPFLISFVNMIISFLKYQIIYLLGSLSIVLNILMCGLTLKNKIIQKNMAMPVVWGFGNSKQLTDQVFIDKNKLAFSNILLTQEGWVIDNDSKNFLSFHKTDIVELDKIKSTFTYFFRRIIIDYGCIFFPSVFFLNILTKRWFLSIYLIRFCKNFIRYEIFLQKYFFRVYLTRDEYSVNSNIRTLVFNKAGIKTVGLPHGDYNHPFLHIVEAFSYLQLDEYFIWGKGYEYYLRITNRDIKKYTPVGISRINFIKKSFSEQNSFIDLLRTKCLKHKILSVFTGYVQEQFLKDKPQRLRENINYFNSILNVYKKNKEKYKIYLVFKYKGKCAYEDIASALKDLLNIYYKDDPNVAFYDIEKNSYNLIDYSDVVIAWGITSIGLEAIAAYKPVIYYDPYKSRYNILRSLFGSKIVTWNEDEFSQSLEEILSGKRQPRDEIYEYIRKEFCNVNAASEDLDPAKLFRDAIYNNYL